MVTVSIVAYPPESAKEIGKRYFELMMGFVEKDATCCVYSINLYLQPLNHSTISV